MGTDVILQALLLVFTLALLVALHTLPKRAFSSLRNKNRSSIKSKHHFVQGAQLLARARSTRNPTQSNSLAKSASNEADLALSLDPKDAAAHILKALSLDLQGHKSSALKSLDHALSPPAVKSLSDRERGDALFKRAELQVAVNRRRRIDSAVEDLVEAVELSPENCKAFCLLGYCYEQKGMKEEAREVYKKAISVDGSSDAAREGLKRLG